MHKGEKTRSQEKIKKKQLLVKKSPEERGIGNASGISIQGGSSDGLDVTCPSPPAMSKGMSGIRGRGAVEVAGEESSREKKKSSLVFFWLYRTQEGKRYSQGNPLAGKLGGRVMASIGTHGRGAVA